MNNPTVSVIIPAYNAAGTIRKAIDSVLAQTHLPDEILVIDDGSPDDLVEVISDYGPPVQVIRKENGGAASARNVGIDNATGDLIAFLDADDYWEPEKLRQYLSVYRANPEIGLSCGAYFSRNPESDVRTTSATPDWLATDSVFRPTGSRIFEFALQAWTGTVVVPRAIIGGERFVSGLEPAEDRDFWVRVVEKAPVYFHSTPLSTAVLVPDSLSRGNVDRDCGRMMQVVERHRSTLGFCAHLRWVAHTYFRWAAMHPRPLVAIRHLFFSFISWPFPICSVTEKPLIRVRLLARLVLDMLGRKSQRESGA